MSFSFFAPSSLFESTLFDAPTVKGRGGGRPGTFELTTPASLTFRPSALLPTLPYYTKPDLLSPLEYPFGGDEYGAPDWALRSATFPRLDLTTTTTAACFPVPSYQLEEEGLFASDLLGDRDGANASNTTSPTSSFGSSLILSEPDPERGLVDDPEKVAPSSTLKELAKVKESGRLKRKCVTNAAAPVVEGASPKKARKKAKEVKADSEDDSVGEGDEGSEFEPEGEGVEELVGGKRKRVKKSATERRERRKATNRASAKAFRARRKNMLADIQAQISERDEEISNLRSLIGRLKDERVTLVTPAAATATPATRSSSSAAAAKRPSSAP